MEQETIVVAEAQPQTEPVKDSGRKGLLKRAIKWIRSRLSKNNIGHSIPWLILVFCVVALIGECNNYYKTPIKYSAKISNQEIYDIEKVSVQAWNGLATKELRQILCIMHNSDAYQEILEHAEYQLQREYNERMETYGENYEVTVKEVYRYPLSVYELREYRREIREIISEIGYLVDSSEEFKSVDWRELADELELTKDEAKELIAVYGELVNKMEPVQVTEGYEVYLEKTVTGDLLKEPEVSEQTVTVVKLNGRWILLDIFDTMDLFFDGVM